MEYTSTLGWEQKVRKACEEKQTSRECEELLEAEDVSAETRDTPTADFQLDLAHEKISPRLHQDMRCPEEVLHFLISSQPPGERLLVTVRVISPEVNIQ